MIRYAVVGAGWISQEAFLPGVHTTDNSVVTAIVSGNTDAAEKLAAFHDVPYVCGYEGYDDLLASDRIDAVYIALPNSMHADYAIRAAKAGKHILVEKPLANTVEEAEAMIAAAREAGVFLMTAYRLHTEPGNLDALRRIRAGEIGKPIAVQTNFCFQNAAGNHRLKAEHLGGALQDVGVYCVNAVRHIFGEEPTEARAQHHWHDDDPRFDEVPATTTATLNFPSGGVAQFVASFAIRETAMFRVMGTKGWIELDPGFRFEYGTTMRVGYDNEIETTLFPQVDQFGGQTSYFSDCIKTGKEPVSNGEEGLADMRALIAIEEAARTGKVVQIDSPARDRHPDMSMERRCPVTDRRLVLPKAAPYLG